MFILDGADKLTDFFVGLGPNGGVVISTFKGGFSYWVSVSKGIRCIHSERGKERKTTPGSKSSGGLVDHRCMKSITALGRPRLHRNHKPDFFEPWKERVRLEVAKMWAEHLVMRQSRGPQTDATDDEWPDAGWFARNATQRIWDHPDAWHHRNGLGYGGKAVIEAEAAEFARLKILNGPETPHRAHKLATALKEAEFMSRMLERWVRSPLETVTAAWAALKAEDAVSPWRHRPLPHYELPPEGPPPVKRAARSKKETTKTTTTPTSSRSRRTGDRKTTAATKQAQTPAGGDESTSTAASTSKFCPSHVVLNWFFCFIYSYHFRRLPFHGQCQEDQEGGKNR